MGHGDTSADEALTSFGSFYKPSSITQKYGDRERKRSPLKSWRTQPLNESLTPTSARKTCVMGWPSPLLTFLLLVHKALLREDQLPLDGAGHSVPRY